MRRALFVLVLSTAILAPAVASAQSVMVLGIRSLEGDDDFTRNLTGALRYAATRVTDWEVSDREVTFVQMALVHNCDNPNPACLAEIARSLEVERLIYGDVRRTSSGSNFQFALNLHHFSVESGNIEHSVTDVVPSIRRDIDDLRQPAQRWMRSLEGSPETGSLRVNSNAPGAEVTVDGAPAGVTDGSGSLTVSGLEAGTHQVELVADGYGPYSGHAMIEPSGEVSLDVELQEGGGGEGGGGSDTDLILGSVLLVAAAGLSAVWIYAAVSVHQLNEDETYQMALGQFEDNVDVCSQSEAQLMTRLMDTNLVDKVRDTCDEAGNLLEPLQFAFIGLSALAGGLGLYFLISGATSQGGSEDGEAVAFELVPSVGPRHAYLGARVRF